MLDKQGMGDDSLRILKLLNNPQIVFFSATFTEEVRIFAAKVLTF
jgi:superfamily II DNA/RNA helicase